MNSKKKIWCFWATLVLSVMLGKSNIYPQVLQKKIVDRVILAEQIPESDFASITTEQLIQKYLKTRYSRYIFLYPHNVNYAFEKAYKDFNGLRELLKRTDIVKSLIDVYQRMDPGAFKENWTPAEKGGYSFNFVFIEILLSQDSILERFSKTETRTILNELIKKQEQKVKHLELYSMFDIQFNAFSIAKLLDSKGKENGISQSLLQVSGMNDFLDYGKLKSNEVLPMVMQKAKEFLNIY